MAPSEVGMYGLFVASVAYGVFVVGAEFNTFSSREIIKAHPEKRGGMIKGHLALSLVLYLFIIPVSIFILYNQNWSNDVIFFFIPLLILEHLNQEISRLLIAMSEQLSSSIVLLLRQAAWAIAAMIIMIIFEESRNINAILWFWTIFSALAVVLGVHKIFQLDIQGWKMLIDWAWVKKGLWVSSGFFIATLALRAVQTFDRFWLESLENASIVGAYVIYAGVAGVLLVFLEAGIFSFLFPLLIRLVNENNDMEAGIVLMSALWQTIFISVTFAFSSMLILPILIDWLDNEVYSENIFLYKWIVSSTIFFGLSLVPHYGLYSNGADKPIIYGHILAMFLFFIFTFIFSFYTTILAIPLGLNVSFAFLFIWKFWAYFKFLSRNRALLHKPA